MFAAKIPTWETLGRAKDDTRVTSKIESVAKDSNHDQTRAQKFWEHFEKIEYRFVAETRFPEVLTAIIADVVRVRCTN